MRSVVFLLGTAAWVLLDGALAQKMILMENFDPEQAAGIWYSVERTGTLYNNSATCTMYEVKHKDGMVYEVELTYRSKSNTMMKNTFRILEDSDHPAQFFFADQDNQKVAVRFLGTDYKNWNVCFGYVYGNIPVYGISSRTPTLDPKYLEEAMAIMKGSTEKCTPM
nr:uncharacterized protein LOC126541998 [Dermacentor andersoni]